jgi:hypothetical protein
MICAFVVSCHPAHSSLGALSLVPTRVVALIPALDSEACERSSWAGALERLVTFVPTTGTKPAEISPGAGGRDPVAVVSVGGDASATLSLRPLPSSPPHSLLLRRPHRLALAASRRRRCCERSQNACTARPLPSTFTLTAALAPAYHPRRPLT